MARPMNDDVLISIMDILVLESARSTAAAFMSLSRRLYHEGGKLLLSGNIDLRTSSDVSSFIAFCLAEDASRAACVRDLTFTINLLSPALASSLAEVIPRFIGIKKLVLTRADFLLRGHDALSRAFASLTSLEDLTLIKGSASAEFLTTLQSNLRNLTLFEIMIPRGLTGAQSTAELSTLNITYLWMDILVLEPYINTFPRLSRLTVTNGALRDLNSKRPRYAAFSCGLGGPQDLQNLRCINQAAQVDGGWEALEELDTDLATSWILGLSCKVVRLVLYVPPETDLRLLPEVLRDVRPEVLELTLTGDGFLQHVVSIPSPLDSMILTLALSERDVGMPKRCVEHLARCFAPSGVQILQLKLWRLGNVDAEVWMDCFQRGIPSLTEIKLEIVGDMHDNV